MSTTKPLTHQVLRLFDLLSPTTRRIEALSQRVEMAVQKSYQIQRETLIKMLLDQPRYADPRRLNAYEHRVYSQSGQDGILEEIFRRIGLGSGTFVEFGVGAGGGFQNNSSYLLAKGWKGCWIEADPDSAARIQSQMAHLIGSGSLRLLHGRVTAENIVSLFRELKVAQEFDLLSIDIDSSDYWVWKQLVDYRPRAVVIEYNSFLPASADWVLPYDAAGEWRDMNMEFGAALKAFERLGREMGYSLVGCDLTGSDAFFVRDDLVGDKFFGPFTAENHYEPMRYYLIQDWGYARTLSPRFGVIR